MLYRYSNGPAREQDGGMIPPPSPRCVLAVPASGAVAGRAGSPGVRSHGWRGHFYPPLYIPFVILRTKTLGLMEFISPPSPIGHRLDERLLPVMGP
jgi:hypothetical protein